MLWKPAPRHSHGRHFPHEKGPPQFLRRCLQHSGWLVLIIKHKMQFNQILLRNFFARRCGSFVQLYGRSVSLSGCCTTVEACNVNASQPAWRKPSQNITWSHNLTKSNCHGILIAKYGSGNLPCAQNFTVINSKNSSRLESTHISESGPWSSVFFFCIDTSNVKKNALEINYSYSSFCSSLP